MDREFLFNTLFTIPATAAESFALTYMLTIPRRWRFVILFTVGSETLRLLLGAIGLTGWISVLSMAYMLAMTWWMCRDKAILKLIGLAVFFVLSFLSEAIGLLLYTALNMKITSALTFNMMENPGAYAVWRVLVLLVIGLVFWAGVLVWNRAVRKTGSGDLLLFVLFPVSQMALCWYAFFQSVRAGGTMWDYWVLTALALLSVAADVVMLWAIRRLRAADEARLRADFWEQQLSRQQTYYDQMVQKAEETSRIRHDLRNQLQAVCFLFREGSSGEANRLLDELESSLSAGQTYCENRVVNAVLTEKAAACRTAGVRLESDVALSREPGIGERDLCSLFANLLDNALAGSRASGAAEPYIRISGAVKQGALAVRCRNSAKAPEKKSARRDPLAEHGWGLTILEELAARYGGSLETAYANGEYDARAILPGPEKTA